MFLDENYELSSNTEIDMLLVELPLNLLKENIRYQVNNPLSTGVNYVETVEDKIRIMRNSYADNPEAIANINMLIQDFFGFLISEIDNKFDLGVSIDDNDMNQIMETGIVLYNFLILNYKKNITKMVYRFIIKNKKSIVSQFSDQLKRKDVTSNSLKKMTKNKDDVLILANLPNIIKYIVTLDLEALDFLKYAANDENYEASYISNIILSGNMLGNFVDSYFQIVIDEYDYILDEVQTDVRLKLLKKM